MYLIEKDIGVFVELAGSTFGEDDLAAQKSLLLHNALNGYIPLLYEIEAENSDYKVFLDACKKVWKSLETDPELPESLVCTRNSNSNNVNAGC